MRHSGGQIRAIIHLIALNQKVISKKYNHPKAHRSLFVYHNQATLDAILTKLTKEIEGTSHWFLFKSYDEVISHGKFINAAYEGKQSKDFLMNWKNAKGEITSMF